MSFKEWCASVLGIVTINDGKITPIVIFPSVDRTYLDDIARFYGAYYVNSPAGIAFRKTELEHLCRYLDQQYAQFPPFPKTNLMFEQNRNHYFSRLGIHYTHKLDDRLLPSIHLTFKSFQEKQKFMHDFAEYYPRESYDVINEVATVEMPAGFLSQLKDMFYASQKGTILKASDATKIREQLENLEQLKAYIQQYHLEPRLDQAQRLSLDYDNSTNQFYAACSAYALSIKVFTEANKDHLTEVQYQNLMYASSMLAAYDDQGHLKQSLKTDANFMDYLLHIYIKNIGPVGFSERPLITQLPGVVSQELQDLLYDDITNLLYGNPQVTLGRNTFKMKRFLPDAHGFSETNEIVFQAGGMVTHSAMFRIIKVGILANGQPASNSGDIPHHYEYYKIDSNVGGGCHNPDFESNTCLGTYITKLQPFVRDPENNLFPSYTSPFVNPQQYQADMEVTLRELIAAERQLMFYRMPGPSGQDSSIPGSSEENEWIRLDGRKQLLSGQYHSNPVYYFSHDRIDPNKTYSSLVCNQRSYLQEAGSCTIFSLKQLVFGLIGCEMTALHNEFIQRNNGASHVALIDQKISDLRNMLQPGGVIVPSEYSGLWVKTFAHYLNIKGPIKGIRIIPSNLKEYDLVEISEPALKQHFAEFSRNQRCEFLLNPDTAEQQISSFSLKFASGKLSDCTIFHNKIIFSDPMIAYLWEVETKKPGTFAAINPPPTFFKPPTCLQKLQTLNLAGANSMQSAELATDFKDPNKYVIKLKFPDTQSAQLFALSIEQNTTNDPKVPITPQNEVILGENRSKVLFENLKVNGTQLVTELAQDSPNPNLFEFK